MTSFAAAGTKVETPAVMEKADIKAVANASPVKTIAIQNAIREAMTNAAAKPAVKQSHPEKNSPLKSERRKSCKVANRWVASQVVKNVQRKAPRLGQQAAAVSVTSAGNTGQLTHSNRVYIESVDIGAMHLHYQFMTATL